MRNRCESSCCIQRLLSPTSAASLVVWRRRLKNHAQCVPFDFIAVKSEHGIEAGEFVELRGLDALELEHDGLFDPAADEKALRRQERVAEFA
jgi:hypothetical protein